MEGEWGILLGGDFFSAGKHLRRSAFDHSNLFEIKKHHYVNTEHQPVRTKNCYKVKMKMVHEQ